MPTLYVFPVHGKIHIMLSDQDAGFLEILEWARTILGPCQYESDDSREHPGQRASTLRLQTPAGACYVKLHRDPAHWANEVHGYECWADAFGNSAPRLLAVRDVAPLAIIISALPGRSLEATRFAPRQEQAIWQAAGAGLAGLHRLPPGDFFGSCRRDGSPLAAQPFTDARAYLDAELGDLEERGAQGSFFSADERDFARAARGLLPAFTNERPTACHRDYCPANWLVTSDGRWCGVIDFEFSYWDVRSADFSRLPNWEWVHRPDLIAAFRTGYGRAFTPAEEQQNLFSAALYALGAIVWGEENAYHGFAREGRAAVELLRKTI